MADFWRDTARGCVLFSVEECRLSCGFWIVAFEKSPLLRGIENNSLVVNLLRTQHIYVSTALGFRVVNMTPTKEMIAKKALELWEAEQYRRGCPELGDLTPEMEELRESGFLSVATSELMRSESQIDAQWKSYAEALEKPKQPERPENLAINGVPFDVDLACDSGFYVSGTSQSGKTNLAKLLVQKLIQSGIHVFVVDPSRAWTHDSPISDMVAVDTTITQYGWSGSTVFDVSALSTRFKVLFVNQLCKDIYEMHVNGYEQKEFIIFEEAQSYLPQGSMRLATRKASPCESIINLITTGANFNLRYGLISQFSSAVDKLAVKITQQRYIGATWEPNDTAYLKGFLGKTWAEKLKTLARGEFVYQCRGTTELIRTPRYGQIARAEGQLNFVYQYSPFLSTETFI